MRDTEHGLAAYGVTAVATLALSFTELNPLLALAGGALVLVLAGG
jgi:hypothetical protein